jgi:hypothetical protein
MAKESLVFGGVVGGAVGLTAGAVYLAERDAAPYHEQGRALLLGACDDPRVQEAVAGALARRLLIRHGLTLPPFQALP